MKSYTDISQSKKLAEILPLESADHFHIIGHLHTDGPRYEVIRSKNEVSDHDSYWPCWSLAALLDVLESEIDVEEGETYKLNIEKDGAWWNIWYRERYDEAKPIEIESTEELIDACYKIIIKLYEQNLL